MLQVKELKVWFPIKRGVFPRVTGYVRAVDGVTVTIKEGETLGLVGESGCGKTTLGRTISGLEKASSGEVFFQGKNLSLLKGAELREQRKALQMIFQDPFASLNPRMSILELITEALHEHKLLQEESRQDAAARLMREVGLEPESMYRFPHEFSGGQRQRISIARALSLQPKFVVCDEPVSALDVSVQAQIINLLLDLRDKHRLTYLFISHDLSVVRLISQKLAVMYLGKILEYGDSDELLENPLHPYTKALIAAIPVISEKKQKDSQLLAGEAHLPASRDACAFLPRCPYALPQCSQKAPALLQQKGRAIACHLYDRQ